MRQAEAYPTKPGLGPPARPVIEFVKVNLAAERVAMDAEEARGARLIAPRAVQYAFDEFLFEFVDRLIEMDPALHHLADESFELILHRSTLRKKVVSGRAIPPGPLLEFVAR